MTKLALKKSVLHESSQDFTTSHDPWKPRVLELARATHAAHNLLLLL